ncbi:MAG: FAD-dependent monooxygenase [Pseudomonadota bacterium]|nr:FAD-dependent monooxygenase [Pseudomonadota bacterium]
MQAIAARARSSTAGKPGERHLAAAGRGVIPEATPPELPSGSRSVLLNLTATSVFLVGERTADGCDGGSRWEDCQCKRDSQIFAGHPPGNVPDSFLAANYRNGNFFHRVSKALRTSDIVIIGGGLGGTVAAIVLGRAGHTVTLVDLHTVYPPDFRAEQLVGGQIEMLRSLAYSTASSKGSSLSGAF